MNFLINKFQSSSKATSPPSLGKRLTASREAIGLSIEEAATKTGLSKAFIGTLESDLQEKNLIESTDSAYQRLFVLRYCKLLNIPLDEIYAQLPPMASLNPKGRSFLKNWNQKCPLPPASCWRDPSSRLYFPPRLGLSLVRIGFLIFLMLFFFYTWELLRHLYRASAH